MAKGKYQKWIGTDGLLLLAAWARDGLTDEQISHNMGIRRSTLSEWKNKFPDISDALKKNKEIVDVEVENALLKRAKGYEFTEEKIEVETNRHGQVVGRKVAQTVKQVVPDVGAAAMWLKNRRPDRWRDNPTVSDTDTGQLEALLKGLKSDV